VRKQIVHNAHVVRQLTAAGAVFVDELDDVPRGAVTVLSAHGSPPDVYERARSRGLRLIDATCPLVKRVHNEVQRYAHAGYCVILIGHAGHDEVVGTMGQAPDQTILIENVEDARRLALKAGERGVILKQTTLSQDDTQQIVAALMERFPQLALPPGEDICYATQNRQNAIKQISGQIDLLLVVGSPNSSNSLRLTEVARSRGVPACLIDGPEDIDAGWLAGVSTVGVSSGASAPEDVVQAVLNHLRALGVSQTHEVEARDEGVAFRLPPFPAS
jgi:4-hydroxy-3-methylbut-2-enyl diphosphate reductase